VINIRTRTDRGDRFGTKVFQFRWREQNECGNVRKDEDAEERGQNPFGASLIKASDAEPRLSDISVNNRSYQIPRNDQENVDSDEPAAE
jgi:hypothetical protein